MDTRASNAKQEVISTFSMHCKKYLISSDFVCVSFCNISDETFCTYKNKRILFCHEKTDSFRLVHNGNGNFQANIAHLRTTQSIPNFSGQCSEEPYVDLWACKR